MKLKRLLYEDEIAEILPLREDINIKRTDNFAELEKQRDAISHVFAFYTEGQLVGTMRCIPFGLGISPVEKHVSLDYVRSLPNATWDTCIEIGRFALAKSHRGNNILMIEMLREVLRYFAEQTGFRYGFVAATRAHTRLYVRFGCTVIRGDIPSEKGSPDMLLSVDPRLMTDRLQKACSSCK